MQSRSAVAGVETVSLLSDRAFPRHSHDAFGVGVMICGAHRSWSGIGTVEAGMGEVIAVNPGEMHDGRPLDTTPRGWRMLYLDPATMRREAEGEIWGDVEIARPVFGDPFLALRLQRAFAALTMPQPDRLAAEESLALVLTLLLHRHVARPIRGDGPTPAIAKIVRRLDEAPELPASLADLAALAGTSRFQLLRGFAREIGTTPHAYSLQRRVGLARRALAAGHALADVAALAGFADQSHLTRAFVGQFGVTPGRYRAAVA